MTLSFLFRLGLLAVLLAAPLPALAQSEQKLPSVSVTGEATISKAPDMAVLQAGVTSQAKTARDAMSASAKSMAAVLVALKDAGIAENDIQTSRLSLQPIRELNRNPATIIAVEASSQLTVRLRDITKSADVLDRMIGAGANLVTGIHFEVSETSKLLDQARAEAVADAKRKAEIYAKAAGVSLGRPLSISEGHVARPMSPRLAMREAAAMPIQPGEEKIGITVQVSYELLR
ncbi:MAG: SIMPL domain-containing protein [Pseudorhodoplanes sp.]|nr:SIMPL domain-containing protein [Pseudorhodoplanes sp.]